MLIGDYLVMQNFTTAGGGRGEWSFARKGGKVYFIKRFLSPKPVTPGQLGGAQTLERRRRRCAAFEARQNRILAALEGQLGEGGNLIAPIDFFQFEGSYYKVTEKIDSRGVTAESVHTLAPGMQLIILRSAVNSLGILHKSGIVHGDLKADNVLIRARAGGLLTAALIDFDDSYFTSEPPIPPEEFVFDPPYAAPEAFLYVLDPDPFKARALTCAADIFGLGILFHEYLTGRKPRIADAASAYVGEALIEGGALDIALPPPWDELEPLTRAMLDRAPHDRPRIDDVKEA
ncbi:MAG: protein kinase, partial [Alphaproteobacteria bacterium]|nr:protein kinase [Alphaproteobacteria bacterium]